MDKSINQIIKALMELEAKGCHTVFFEYGSGLFRVRIFRGEADVKTIVYEKTINTTEEQTEADEMYGFIKNLYLHTKVTSFQCYKRVFIKGKKASEWEKAKSTIEFGENATYAMLIDGSGYYIDDPDNHLQYFVDYKQSSETH